MAQSFLVVLEDNSDALIHYAVSVGKALGGHATAIYPRRDATGLEDGSLEARFEAAVGGAETRKTHAREALQRFAEAAARAGIAVEILEPEAGQDRPRDIAPRDIAPRFARAFDFAIAQQQKPGQAPARDNLVAALLAESGRPAGSFLPFIWTLPASSASSSPGTVASAPLGHSARRGACSPAPSASRS